MYQVPSSALVPLIALYHIVRIQKKTIHTLNQGIGIQKSKYHYQFVSNKFCYFQHTTQNNQNKWTKILSLEMAIFWADFSALGSSNSEGARGISKLVHLFWLFQVVCQNFRIVFEEFQTVVDHDSLRGQIRHPYTMFYDSNTIAYIVVVHYSIVEDSNADSGIILFFFQNPPTIKSRLQAINVFCIFGTILIFRRENNLAMLNIQVFLKQVEKWLFKNIHFDFLLVFDYNR